MSEWYDLLAPVSMAEIIRRTQIEEGKLRQGEEPSSGIMEIDHKRCIFAPNRSRGNIEEVKATIVGAYFHPSWHPYVYKAYHIITDEGTKTTIPADWVIRTWEPIK